MGSNEGIEGYVSVIGKKKKTAMREKQKLALTPLDQNNKN